MSLTSESSSSDSDSESLSVLVLVVGARVYSHPSDAGRKYMLSLELLSLASGRLFELKTWHETKCFTVYRKVKPGNYYVLSNIELSDQRKPNPKYSHCSFEVSHGHWWLEHVPNPMRSAALSCTSNLNKANVSFGLDSPVDFAGIYLSRASGPLKGHIQGYHVRLMDDGGSKMWVLVWHNPGVDRPSNFDLLSCEPGDILLFPALRKNEKGCTTLYPPVRRPDFLHRDTRMSLVARYKSSK